MGKMHIVYKIKITSIILYFNYGTYINFVIKYGVNRKLHRLQLMKFLLKSQ